MTNVMHPIMASRKQQYYNVIPWSHDLNDPISIQLNQYPYYIFFIPSQREDLNAVYIPGWGTTRSAPLVMFTMATFPPLILLGNILFYIEYMLVQ